MVFQLAWTPAARIFTMAATNYGTLDCNFMPVARQACNSLYSMQEA